VVLFGFEQRNDLRPAKYLWPFNVLVEFLMKVLTRSTLHPASPTYTKKWEGKAAQIVHFYSPHFDEVPRRRFST
jgi:hypothetical protein